MDDQVAGYEHVAHENLTFVVVHGAGHFVPSDQSKHALLLLRNFIEQEPFCKAGQTIPLRFATLTPTEIERFVDDPKNPRIPCQISQLICVKVYQLLHAFTQLSGVQQLYGQWKVHKWKMHLQ